MAAGCHSPGRIQGYRCACSGRNRASRAHCAVGKTSSGRSGVTGASTSVLRNFAVYLDRAFGVGQGIDQLLPILQPLYWMGEELLEPARVLSIRLGQVLDSHLKIL